MKVRSAIIGVSFLLAQYSYAQFITLDPPVLSLYYEGACNESFHYDTILFVKNISPTVQNVKVRFLVENELWSDEQQNFPVSKGDRHPIRMRFKANRDPGLFANTIRITVKTDTIVVPVEVLVKPYVIGASGMQYIGMKDVGIGETRCGMFWGRNRTQEIIRFDSIRVEMDSAYPFKLNYTVPLPYYLSPGADLPLVEICFTAAYEGEWYQSRIDVESEGRDDMPSPYIDVSAVKSSVAKDEHRTIVVTPNPARSEVSVVLEHATASKIDVFDVLARMVASTTQPCERWTWQVVQQGIPTGAYFIRIEGITNTGKPFAALRTVLVE